MRAGKLINQQPAAGVLPVHPSKNPALCRQPDSLEHVMRKIIRHLAYDTDKSVLVAVTDTGSLSERLYRTYSGHWFLLVHNPALGPIDEISALTEKDAIAQYNKLALKNPKLNPKERY